MTLTTPIKGMEVGIHKDAFEKMFELPYYGETYTFDGPCKSKNFIHKDSISVFIVDPI